MADHFQSVRNAVATAYEAALAAASVTGVTVNAVDTLDPNLTDFPAVQVSYNAVERPTGGTNVRDDFAYPVVLGLYTLQPDKELAGGDAPAGLSATHFRQLARETFHHRRAVSVSGIDCFLCEYDGQGAVIDEASPAFENLRAAAVVTVYARVPRGS